MGFYYHYERWLEGEETTSSYKFVRIIIYRIRAIGRLTCSLHDGCLNALKTALMVHENTYSCFWMEPNLQDSWVYSLHTHHAPILLNCSFVLGFILVASVFCSFITQAKRGHACAVIEGRMFMWFQSALYWKTAIVFHTSISFDFMMYYKLYAVTCLSVAEGLDLSTCILHALHYSISQGLPCIFQIASNSAYQLTCWLHLVSNLYEYISRIPFMLSLVFRWMLPTSTSNIMLINLDILNQTLILNLVRWSTYLM